MKPVASQANRERTAALGGDHVLRGDDVDGAGRDAGVAVDALLGVDEAIGREIGHDLAPEGGACSAEERMHAALVALGFQPKREVDPAGRLTYRLRNCPYRAAVRESQQIVCTLHRGMTRGLLDAVSLPRPGWRRSFRATPMPPDARSSCMASWPTTSCRAQILD